MTDDERWALGVAIAPAVGEVLEAPNPVPTPEFTDADPPMLFSLGPGEGLSVERVREALHLVPTQWRKDIAMGFKMCLIFWPDVLDKRAEEGSA